MPVEDMITPCVHCGGLVRKDEWGLYCTECKWSEQSDRKGEVVGDD